MAALGVVLPMPISPVPKTSTSGAKELTTSMPASNASHFRAVATAGDRLPPVPIKPVNRRKVNPILFLVAGVLAPSHPLHVQLVVQNAFGQGECPPQSGRTREEKDSKDLKDQEDRRVFPGNAELALGPTPLCN